MRLTTFKKVSEEKFKEIKTGLKKISKISVYPVNGPSILANFDIISLGSKFPVIYYTTGTLLVQGDETNPDLKKALEFIRYCLES